MTKRMSLKEHRLRAVLSTRELADKASVSPATVWRIELGDVSNIRPKTMRALATVLGVRPDEIAEFHAALEKRRDPFDV
jgi:transcriptional regulator with XRE-family HTH domain